MKDIKTSFDYKGKQYPAVFNLNVMEKIQEEYETTDKWSGLMDGTQSGEPDFKALKFGITEAINEAIDIRNEDKGEKEPFVTTKFVGRMLTAIGLEKAGETFQDVIKRSTQDDESEAKNE